MAGLLGDVLPWVYSQGDRAKRYVGGLLADPIGSMQQTAGLLQDYRREDQQLNARAFADQSQPFRVTDKRAMTQLADRAMAGPMGFAPAGITAWHGTPHKFDKFDSSKIGTGEGAQAYGHGLYLAEAPGVAKQYADTLTDRAPKFLDGRSSDQLTSAEKSALGLLAEAGGNAKAALLRAKTDMARSNGAGADFHVERYNTLRAILDGKSQAQVGTPNIYKVDLPDDAVAKMLDWDKPLSQQTLEVQQAIRSQMPDSAWEVMKNRRGQDYMEHYWNAGIGGSGQSVQAAHQLKKMGIPGVRYLDGGSRGVGQGSSNFVVFPGEESLLKILERNGQPLK